MVSKALGSLRLLMMVESDPVSNSLEPIKQARAEESSPASCLSFKWARIIPLKSVADAEAVKTERASKLKVRMIVIGYCLKNLL
jgi:hypothetical protein